MRRVGLLAAAALVGLAACQPTETPEQMQARMDQESAAFKAVIEPMARRWEAWEAAGQADSFTTAFTDDGREMPPNGPALVGAEAIRAYHAQMASMGTFTSQITTETAMANGPLGVDRGRYRFTFKPNKGMENMGVPAADSGKYLVHWHQVNGSWKIADLIYNSDVPLPTPAPARRR